MICTIASLPVQIRNVPEKSKEHPCTTFLRGIRNVVRERS
jgi:hypothetical protein